MPLYDYKCENGHVFEEMQSFSSDPVATCGDCGTSATRMLSVPMVLYKGSGFYTTDYKKTGYSPPGKSEETDHGHSHSHGDGHGHSHGDSGSKESVASGSSSESD